MRSPSALVLVFLLASAACAYILPASWRAFRVDADDAPPAITRALDGLGLPIATFDQEKRRIVTSWIQQASGVTRSRERYVISWERDAKEGLLTIYVRHEAEDQDRTAEGVAKWGTTYHEESRERLVLDRITRELSDQDPPQG